MNVTALLCFHDEPVNLLYRTVSSWAAACDSVIAVEGPFVGFPCAASSVEREAEQVQAIREAANDHGMPVVIYSDRMARTQVEQRSLAFSLGDALADSRDDWLLVIDADEEIAYADSVSAREFLAQSEYDVAEIVADIGTPVMQRRLVRAKLGTRVEGLHYRYVTADGRILWNYPGEPQEPAEVTLPIELKHLGNLRSTERQERRESYYQQRVEKVP